MTNEIEPLDAALWFRRIEMIARGELGSVQNSLRHAAHLLQLTPRPFRHAVRLSLDEAAFEALLDGGDFDIAARHLVAQPTALSVDETTGGTVKATISCTILKRAIDGTGDTVATAVLAAWTTCLLALRTEFRTDGVNLAGEVPPVVQSGPRQRSSLH